jgi:hypothetical protein
MVRYIRMGGRGGTGVKREMVLWGLAVRRYTSYIMNIGY